MLKFLEVFGGKTIKVPDSKAIEKAATEAVIFSKYFSSRHKTQTIKDLSNEYNMSKKDIEKIIKRVKSFRKRLGI